MFHRSSKLPIALGELLLLGLVVCLGCGKTPASAPIDTGGMKALGLIYGKYVSDNGGHRPSNEDSLRKYATAGGGGGLLKQFGVEDPAKLFVSPRDGRPLTISYGTGVVTEGNPVAGYECESTDGKRWVAWTTGSVMLVSDDEFQKIRFAP